MDGTGIHLLAAGTALPGPPVDNATLTRRFGMPPVWEQWIDSFVGTRSRHFAIDLATGEVRYSLADLCVTAAGRALAAAGRAAGEVDLLVLATSSPDQLMPATVNVVADRLGVDGVPTFQLQSGCSGAVQALDVACQMLRGGRHHTALVIGADSCAKHTDLTVDAASLRPDEQVNGVLFGDGAGAAVLARQPGSGSAEVRHVFHRLVGHGRPPGQVVEWFGRGDRDSGRQPLREDYEAIEKSVPLLATEVLDELLDQLDWKESDVDYLLPPQLSGRMTRVITERLGLPAAREVSCVTQTGNTGNALPFFQFEQLLPDLLGGDRALAIAIESSKWIKAGVALEKA
jgi:3-oxoacyl-[acyl-carrier-protein] synthase-3